MTPSLSPSSPRPARVRLARLSLLLLALPLGGCALGGFVAQGLFGDRPVTVEAQYQGLAQKSFAVLVAADEQVLYRYPAAPDSISRAVSARIALDLPGTRPANPKDVTDFQVNNPYWTTLTYAELLRRLSVERLILIDVDQYSTHEPGNAHVWQGLASAKVSVIEAGNANPNDPSYRTEVRAMYPEKATVGLLNSDEQTMQLALLKVFARNVSWRFHAHQEVQE